MVLPITPGLSICQCDIPGGGAPPRPPCCCAVPKPPRPVGRMSFAAFVVCGTALRCFQASFACATPCTWSRCGRQQVPCVLANTLVVTWHTICLRDG